MRIPRSLTLMTLLTVAAPATAQELEPTTLSAWRIPIHTAPDDPETGEYGIWAAGPDYKVSFHDGFTFYPVLGESYPENLPLRWETESIAVGSTRIADADSPTRATYTDWRYELHYPGVVEAYDVRPDGVEQTFTLTRRPVGATAGDDLVVTGRWHTQLTSADRSARHDRLVFCDDRGKPLVEYGAPVALDAAGRRCEMTASLANGVTRLTLDAGWLDRATYPVIVDPLTRPLELGLGDIRSGDIAHGPTNVMFLVESRYNSAGDEDATGRLLNNRFANERVVFADISSNYHSRNAEVAYVAGARYGSFAQGYGRWVVAVEVNYSGPSTIYAYIHNVAGPTMNGGEYLYMNGHPGSESRPTIGGSVSMTSDHALIVFQRDISGDDDRVTSIIVDASDPTPSFGTPTTVDLTPGYRGIWPNVTRNSDGPNSSWVVVWLNVGTPAHSSGDSTGKMARIDHNGAVAGRYPFAYGYIGVPKIDGRQGRYLVVWQDTHPGFPDYHLRARRFDWDESSYLPAVLTGRSIASAPTGTVDNVLDLGANRSVAYDSNTQSHWAVAYQNMAQDGGLVRVGFTAGVVESVQPSSHQVYDTFLCYNPDDYEFPVVMDVRFEQSGEHAVHTRRFQYDPHAESSTYGIGCGGTISANNAGLHAPPYAGSEFLGIDLTGGVQGARTLLVVSTQKGKILLPDGCFFNVGDSWTAAAIGTTDAFGNAYAGPFNLGDEPLFTGVLNWQWLQVVPGKGVVLATEGLRTEVH